MSTSTSSSDSPAWQAAQQHARDAERMLEQESPSLADVARNLRRGWIHLNRELTPSAREGDEHAAAAQMAQRVHEPVLTGEAVARRLVFADPDSHEALALLEAPAIREGLAAEARALHQASVEVASRRDGSATVGLGLSFLVLVLLAFAPLIGDIGGTVTTPWRGRYYDNDKFEGEPRLQSDRLLSFDFGRESPLRGIPKDRFSVRWDTCFVVEEDTTVRFSLSSDDGSRLYVNGDEVIDNWGDHGTETKSARISLDAGVHYLEVEYYEARHGANIKLEVAVGGDKLEVVPVDMIRAPGDGEDPCA